MKAKSRHLIGSILVWTATAVYAAQIIYLIYSGLQNDVTMLKTGLYNLILLIMILVGSLWGMKK